MHRVFSLDLLPFQCAEYFNFLAGGNTGIGYEIIKELLKHNAKVYMASRSQEKATAAIEKLKTETGKEALFLQLDLCSLAAVRKAAEQFLQKEEALHTLFNNACVVAVSPLFPCCSSMSH